MSIIKIKEHNVEDIRKISPIFSNNYTAVAMSCSDKYLPYLSVCLQSLVEHTDSNHNYDIIIFECSIDEKNKKRLRTQISAENISLRFINPMPVIKKYRLKVHANYAIECYFRLAAPLLLPDYERVIFTDIDLIFNSDIKNLDNVDITNKPLAACNDLMFGAFLNYPQWKWLRYAKNVLKLQNPYKYFNTGVLIFNIKELNANNFTKNILKLVSKVHFKILEQDGLNALYQDNIKYIDTAWNYAVEITRYRDLTQYMPKDFYQQYLKDKANPNIIHWAGDDKPWFNPSEEFADIWWNFAKKTPFYNQLKNDLKNFVSIKILVTYKYKHRLLKSDILTPIQSGRAISNEIFKNMIGDDTGENISFLNNIYSELSALYWACKNYDKLGNPYYIGHMHYRRQFLFDTSKLKLNRHWVSSFYKFKRFTPQLLESFSDEKIKKIVPYYDYIIPDWHDVTLYGHKNIREEYSKISGAKIEIFDEFIKICKEKAPEYMDEIERIENGNKVLICNMFIMKKDLFFKYCKFAFPILAELVDKTDATNLSTNGQRFAGYMAEKLLSMFVMKLEKNKQLKEKILTCSLVDYPDYNLLSLLKNTLQTIFSIKNDSYDHKKITIIGIKFKIRRKNKK